MDYTHRLEPFAHQQEIWEETREREFWALFMDMGTGKSKILIDTACWNFLKGKIKGVIVIAKKGEYSNWPLDQLPKHIPENVKWEACLFTSYQVRTKKGRAWFHHFLTRDDGVMKWLVINKEAIGYERADQAIEDFIEAVGPFMTIVDESTCVKHYDRKQSKAVYAIAGQAVLKRIATGTAVTESPLDLWGQCLALGSPKKMLNHSSYYAFRNEYAVVETIHYGPRSFKTVTGYKNQDKLKRVIAGFSTQMTKDECTDLPDKIYKQHVVPLTETQEKLYKQMVNEAIAEYEEGMFIKASNALSTLTKLHQITCGQLRDVDGNYISIDNNRIPAVLSILEGFRGKALIWANYRQSIADLTSAIKNEFGDESCDAYYGGVDEEMRKSIIERFQGTDSTPHDPKFRFIVANQRSLGYGRTLTNATLAIYFSNSFSLEQRLQSEDRMHRIGQAEKVTYIDLVTPSTVDERVFEILRNKRDMSEALVKMSIRNWLMPESVEIEE